MIIFGVFVKTIEEDLDSNKAYTLLKMGMDVKKGIRGEEKGLSFSNLYCKSKEF